MNEEKLEELREILHNPNLKGYLPNVCNELLQELRKTKNIIKEAREMVNKLKNEVFLEDTGNTATGLLYAKPCCRVRLNKIKEVLENDTMNNAEDKERDISELLGKYIENIEIL